jgi:hypothetical protein
MPRKKLIRRFEPRFGVSREMIEVETKYVARDMDDYLLLSTNDLKEKLAKLRESWQQADLVLEAAILHLIDREQLAVQCLVVRDMYHLLELYCTYLRAQLPDVAASRAPSEKPRPMEDRKLPFNEWLFNPSG